MDEPTTPPPIYTTDIRTSEARPSPMSFAEKSTYRAAAARVEKLGLGALGELVSRELLAYDEFGWRMSNDSLITRVRDQVMAQWREHQEALARQSRAG